MHFYIEQLFDHENGPIVEQALWYMGNLAGSDEQCRMLVLQKTSTLAVIHSYSKRDRIRVGMLKTISWCLHNLTRGKEFPLDKVSTAAEVAANFLWVNNDTVVADSLWALSSLTDGENDQIQLVVEQGIIVQTCSKMLSNNTTVV